MKAQLDYHKILANLNNSFKNSIVDLNYGIGKNPMSY